MTLKQLNFLLGIVDNGMNITAAAEHLYTSQPGISRQLKQLEHEIGVSIFFRKGKNLVSLTPAGVTVVELARKVLRVVDNISSVGEEMATEQKGTLSIATTHTQARYVLPEILKQFHECFPHVQIELQQGTSEHIASLVAENKVDFAIATASTELFPELNLLPCYNWNRIVLAPRDHPLAADKSELTLEKLAKYPLVTYVFSSSRESSFMNAFARNNLKPNVVLTAWDADVIKTHVKMGMGVGVIAPMALQCDELKDLVAIDASALFPTVNTWLGFPRDKGLRGYMKNFITLFAPHWSIDLVEQASKAETQEVIDRLARGLDLPTRSSCIE